MKNQNSLYLTPKSDGVPNLDILLLLNFLCFLYFTLIPTIYLSKLLFMLCHY